MLDAIRRTANAVRLAVTRGKVQRTTVGARLLIQVTGLAGELFNDVELLLPYGMTAVPEAGDVVLLQVLGSRDHKLALCADLTSLRIADAQPGEFGFRDKRGQQVVFRTDRIEVTTPLKAVVTAVGEVDVISSVAVNVTAPAINLGSSGETLHKLIDERAAAIFNAHVHSAGGGVGNSGPPTTAIGAGQETSVVSAG